MKLSLMLMKRFEELISGRIRSQRRLFTVSSCEVDDTEISIVMEPEKYLSTGQLMAFLEISRGTIYRLMAKGMPNLLVGSVHRFPVNQVVGWLEMQSGNKLNNRETAMVEI